MRNFSPKIAIPPGETALELMRACGWSRKDFEAQMLGWTSDDVQALIDGTLYITRDIARQLESVLGGTVSLWLNLERQYRADKQKLGEWKRVLPGGELVYLAGPYRGKGRFRVVRFCRRIANIIRAWRAAKRLWAAGYAVICPHANSAVMDAGIPSERFLAGDLLMLDNCDAMVVIGDWRNSEGTLGEIEHCVASEIPWYEGVDAFLREEMGD